MNNSINTLVVNIESILKVDASDLRSPFEKIIENTANRISRSYGFTVTPGEYSYSDDITTVDFRNAVEMGIHSLAAYLGFMSVYNTPEDDVITLMNLKYLGFPKRKFVQLICYLSKDMYVRNYDEQVKKIESKLEFASEVNIEKRLIILMCVAYELKIYELVCLIAGILWIKERKATGDI